MIKFNLGDKVETLVERKAQASYGISICKAGTIGMVCENKNSGWITIEVYDHLGKWCIFNYKTDEVKKIN